MKRWLVIFLVLLLPTLASGQGYFQSLGGGSSSSAGLDVATVTALTADTSPTSDDLMITVNDPGGTSALRKVTLANLIKAYKGYYYFDAGHIVPNTCSGLLQTANLDDYLAFDGATDEYGNWKGVWQDWDLGTIKATFYWGASAAMTNGHTVIWGLECTAVRPGDSTAVSYSNIQTATGTYLSAGGGDETGPKLKVTAATAALTVQGTLVAGNLIKCRVSRDADTDTSTIDAWLFGVEVEYGKTTPTAW